MRRKDLQYYHRAAACDTPHFKGRGRLLRVHGFVMPIAFLDVSTDLLVELCKGLRKGEKPRLYRVKENPLPDDAEVVSALLVGPPECSVVRIAIESGAVTEGQQLPAVWLESVEA